MPYNRIYNHILRIGYILYSVFILSVKNLGIIFFTWSDL